MTTDYQMLIGGEWRNSTSEERLPSMNPFDREVWATIQQASPEDVEQAISTAREAFEGEWKHTNGLQRARLMHRLAELLEADADRMARLETTDNGKVIRETSNQMRFAARNYRFFAGYADKLYGEVIPLDNPTIFDYTAREPLGVVALITAWNSPMGLLANKLAPALAAGNASKNLIPVTLELGGKSPNIVFADADLDQAVPGALAGIFASTGQTCIAGSRLLVESPIYDEVVSLIAERAQAIRLGNPLDPATEMGPAANEAQYQRILEYIETGTNEGARVVTGGEPPRDGELRNGFFISPTVFADVDNHSTIAQEEVFGPVLSIIPFEDEEQAIRIANDTKYGLASGVWTNDLSRAHRVSRQIDAGTVWVNTYRTAAAQAPFGGMKQSGYGRERGAHALQEYVRIKNVMIDFGGEARDPFSIRT